MPLTLRYVARSDAGLVREGNEDAGYAGPYILAVADGMGGHAAGEVASQAAVDELVQADLPPDGRDTLDALAAVVHAANDRIRQLVDSDPKLRGMGTTATLLLWNKSRFGLAHIGDSRAYRLRDHELVQITRDHTFVQALVDDGRISVDDARVHPARAVVTKVLQGDEPIEPDYVMLDVKAGDRFLLCSDGLSDVVGHDDLRAALDAPGGVEAAADRLMSLALQAGGPDNVTVVLADVVETDSPPQPDDTAEAYLVGAVAGAGTSHHEGQSRRDDAPR
ncbi:PP2C family serine/threonine-protein phosphatase [Haloactinopolyspora sp.]|uniref:PP2C family protein-serine/threonine phosphatase n=1 Tax=Haloactinopolyspora sp. TaxID=1966353 RepID=UPI00260688CD|nr:PP2C family serine/threonine-protein phosphatase [Haloactinopolyspora sp.]